MRRKIAPDKWRHLIVGILMGAFLQVALLWLIPGHPYLATAAALFAVVGISYGFELFSKFTGKGVYEIADAVFSIAGGVLGMLLAAGGLAVVG
ncbi:MAG: hypothetical protein EOO05_16485 [Chitinophagaceae bacterium]|nr:MAG: hypothetical protein EOO05_16485 [Chitinophagaceae bacterium]